jgi:hypothetical protein
MLLHLIIWAIRAATEGASKGPKLASQRTVASGEVVLQCPACNELGVAQIQTLETRVQDAWMPQMELYECGNCHQTQNAALFKNDGTGVMVVNTWTCSRCRAQIPATSSVCLNCK